MGVRWPCQLTHSGSTHRPLAAAPCRAVSAQVFEGSSALIRDGLAFGGVGHLTLGTVAGERWVSLSTPRSVLLTNALL